MFCAEDVSDASLPSRALVTLKMPQDAIFLSLWSSFVPSEGSELGLFSFSMAH